MLIINRDKKINKMRFFKIKFKRFLIFWADVFSKIKLIFQGRWKHIIFNLFPSLYNWWLEKNKLSLEKIEEIKAEIKSFPYQPKISVVMPVYNIDRIWLEKAIQSVINQIYQNWELCIVDDGSIKEYIPKILTDYSNKDRRIKFRLLDENQGISLASNQGLSLTTGEYITFLDHDDELSQDSLYEIVKFLNTHREADIIYTNEDKITIEGKRIQPIFKLDWSAKLLLRYNYLCHLTVIRRELIEKVGGFRQGFEESQDYDLLLRITELTVQIFHLPKILYHWRMISGSAALIVDAKKQAFERSKTALREAMKRRGYQAVVKDAILPGKFKVKIKNLKI